MKGAGKSPFFVLLRLPDPAQPDLPDWGVIVKTNDPAAVIKALAQEGGEKPKSLDGYESFVAEDGETLYATKGTGWVAYGPEEAMIKAIHKPQSSLAGALSPEGRARFLAGDVGLYVNIAAVQKQYGDFLEQSKQAIKAQLEEAMGAEAGKTQTAWTADILLNSLITALKVGDRLALSLDFQADGLTIAGLATVKGDSPAAQGLARAGTGTGQLLERLPAGNMVYVYGADALGYPGGQARSGAGAPRSKVALAVKKAEDARIRALEDRLVIAISMAPMKATTLADPADPSAAAAASRELFEAPRALVRDGRTVALNALTYGGFRLDKVRIEFDPAGLAKSSPARHAARSPALRESHGRKGPDQPHGQRRQAVLRGDERIRRSGQGPDRRRQDRRGQPGPPGRVEGPPRPAPRTSDGPGRGRMPRRPSRCCSRSSAPRRTTPT